MSRTHPQPVLRRALPTMPPFRLDVLPNPFGPSVHVHDALAGAEDLHLPAGPLETRLHLRLAALHHVGPDWLTIANGVDELLGMLLLWRREAGPLALFPPTAPEPACLAALHGLETFAWRRSAWFTVDIESNQVRDFPRRATAYVQSPNDPTGTLLGNQDLVRLTRACESVIVDERHVEYSGRTLLPFVREFENLVVVRTLETWAGLTGLPVAYAVASPHLSAELARFRRPGGVSTASVIAALATLDDLAYVRATVTRVRDERARLYRMLRKLNMLTPYPSAANFVLARIERGDVDWYGRELARRGLQIHRPVDPTLANHLRFSAGSFEATVALRQALIEIAAEL